MLMLLPLQWSWAAAAWYGTHASSDTSATANHSAPAAPADTPSPDDEGAAPTDGSSCGDDPCCHLDEPQWLEPLPPMVSPPRAGPPRFEYFAPTSSHIPAGPERPDRPSAA